MLVKVLDRIEGSAHTSLMTDPATLANARNIALGNHSLDEDSYTYTGATLNGRMLALADFVKQTYTTHAERI